MISLRLRHRLSIEEMKLDNGIVSFWLGTCSIYTLTFLIELYIKHQIFIDLYLIAVNED